jgi:hypothetical protein
MEWLDTLPPMSAQQPEPPKKDGILKTIGKTLISSELKFGKSIADALPGFVPGSAAWTNKQNEELMKRSEEIANNLLKTIKEKKAREMQPDKITIPNKSLLIVTKLNILEYANTI